VAALALAVASLGLVEAAAPRTIATGTIHGTVTLPAVRPAAGRRSAGPAGTSAADREQDALDRQTSVVYLDNMPRGMAGESVERKARLDQRGQRLRAAHRRHRRRRHVDFPNSDPFFHNVFSLSDVRSFDLGRLCHRQVEGGPLRQARRGPCLLRHPRPHERVHLRVRAPYFAVTDGVGRYPHRRRAAGTHQLVLWNETIDPETAR
jgi:hypothetical protein